MLRRKIEYINTNVAWFGLNLVSDRGKEKVSEYWEEGNYLVKSLINMNIYLSQQFEEYIVCLRYENKQRKTCEQECYASFHNKN